MPQYVEPFVIISYQFSCSKRQWKLQYKL